MPPQPMMGDLLNYCRKDLAVIIISLIFAAGGAVLTIIGPKQISKITDLITAGLMTQIDMAGIARVGCLLVVIYAASALLTFLQHYLMAGFNQRLSKRMRGDIVAKINRLPLSYFNFHEHRCFLLQPAAAVFGALDRDIRFSSGELRSLCVDAVPYFLKEQGQTLA